MLAHLIGNDGISRYVHHLSIDRANAAMVREGRALSREELLRRGNAIARRPSSTGRLFAWRLVGDCAMHHQDVLRGLGEPHASPDEAGQVIFREGTIWSWLFGAELPRYRVQPTTPGGTARGRGQAVRGSTEALALRLAAPRRRRVRIGLRLAALPVSGL